MLNEYVDYLESTENEPTASAILAVGSMLKDQISELNRHLSEMNERLRDNNWKHE